MRFYLLTGALVCSLLVLTDAAPAEEPRAILDRAIEAHGGAARLELTKKGHLKAKWEVSHLNALSKLEIEEWFDLPGRYKQSVDTNSNGTHLHAERAYAGSEGWKQEGTAPVQTLTVQQPEPAEDHWHAILLTLLLLRTQDVQLKSLPDEVKDGRTLVGFKAVKAQRAGDYYFDKTTGLLARTKGTSTNAWDGAIVSAETLYDDYHDIKGIHYPMRFRVAAGYTSTIAFSSVEFGNSIDSSIFAKPHISSVDGPTEVPNENDEKHRVYRERTLIVAMMGVGIVIGAVWFIVRVSKRGKRETPPN